MKKQLDQVIEFHKKFNIPFEIQPTLALDRAKIRIAWIQEELNEYSKALERINFVDVMDALGDMLYVLYGSIIEHGLQHRIEFIFDEIHRSNMTKTLGDGKGKITKGSDFQAPNLSPIGIKDNDYRYKPHKVSNDAGPTDCYLPQKGLKTIIWYAWDKSIEKERCRLCRIANREIKGKEWERAILSENWEKIYGATKK